MTHRVQWALKKIAMVQIWMRGSIDGQIRLHPHKTRAVLGHAMPDAEAASFGGCS